MIEAVLKPHKPFEIRSHHSLVQALNLLSLSSRRADKTHLSILSVIGQFCNYKSESCTVYVETIIDKAFELGLSMPAEIGSQKKKISRAISWGVENLPGFSRELNSNRNCFGEYKGRKASTYRFDLKVIQDYFNKMKPLLVKRNYQDKKRKTKKADKKAYFAKQQAKQNKMSSTENEVLSSSNNKYDNKVDITSDSKVNRSLSLSAFNLESIVRAANGKLQSELEFYKRKLAEIDKKRKAKAGKRAPEVHNPVPVIKSDEQYREQFENETKNRATHLETVERNQNASSFTDGFFKHLGETEHTLKRKGIKAIRYRTSKKAIEIRVAQIYSESGEVEFTLVEERLKTDWGDSSYNTFFLGPPGTGKTMLASRLCDLLPEMSDEEAMETASVASLTQSEINEHNWKSRPFRAPHHSSSMAALVGGGSVPRPGEISLAHNGLLFLDEMPEFDRKVLDSLREPLESGEIIISRAQGKTRFPARFQLVGALNPSPTGYYEGNQARTNPQAILRYLGRLSGPLLDRFDMSLEIPSLPKGTLAEGGDRGEPTELVKERVSLARESMLNRNGKVNALLGSREIEAFCPLQKSDAEFLETALHRLGLSIRAYHRIIKVARTIADLEGAEQIERSHLAEALGYRAMDRLLKQLTAQAV